MIPRHHNRNTARSGGFSPSSGGKVSGWLRLAASAQSGGDFVSLSDVLNPASPATQSVADRRCAAGAAANGLPTLVFDGSDMYQWPLVANINNMTTKLGFWLWFRPSTVASVQRLLNITIATGAAATFEKLSLYANNRTLVCEVYATNLTGRTFTTTTNVLTAGAWTGIYLRYDSSPGGDANLAIATDGVFRSTTGANIGIGATLGALQAPTGNILIGSFNNSSVQAIDNLGQVGPNLFAFRDNLTIEEIAAFFAFERPT